MKKARWTSLIVVVVAVILGIGNPAYGELGDATTVATTLDLRVVADLSTFDMVTRKKNAGGPFYVGGTIFDSLTGAEIGKFHCWGWSLKDGSLALVNQEFDLTGRGKIILIGVEDPGPRAIVGGTGNFKNARGQATSTDFSNFPPEFTITIKVKKN